MICILNALFSPFFFQGQFKLSKYKNHIVKVHQLAIILFCMCVFVQNGWEVSSWAFHLLTEGTSLSCVLPFALFPGGRILLDTLQHRGLCKVEKQQTWLCNRHTFFNGFLWGEFSLLFCCALSGCLLGLLLRSLLYEGRHHHVYKPELSTENYQCYECLRIQEELFVRESRNSCKCSLLALPLNYWDILFISLPTSPKPTKAHFLKRCYWFCVVSCLMPSSLPSSCGTLSFLGTAALRIAIQWATCVSLRWLRRYDCN